MVKHAAMQLARPRCWTMAWRLVLGRDERLPVLKQLSSYLASWLLH